MTHGSHWECIVPDIEEFFETHFSEIVQNSNVIGESKEYGYNIATEKEQENVIHTLLYPQDSSSPYKILTQIVNKQLWTSYPVLNFGMTHEVIITDINDEGNFVEAQISCKLKRYPDFGFTFFDTMYHKNKSLYIIGNTYSFLFNGFMYSCGENQFANTKIPNAEIDDIWIDKNTVVCLASENGDMDDYKVISPILDVESFDSDLGIKMYKIRIILLQDDICFDIPVLIAEQNLKDGFIPHEGDSINGSLWLCGMMKAL